MLNNDQFEIVENKIKEGIARLKEKLGFQMLKPNVFYDINGTKAGVANIKYKTLHFNPILLEENFNHFIENVVPHELAHLAVYDYCDHVNRPYPKAIHGKTWELIMFHLGANPRVTHTYNVEKVRKKIITFEYSCLCKEPKEIPKKMHLEILAGKNYICKICKETMKNGKRKVS